MTASAAGIARALWSRNDLASRSGFGWLLAALCVLNLLVSLRARYFDHDPMIYTMIGEAIWQHGVWPYGHMFDHKPFAGYLVYGLLAFLPRNIWEFHLAAWLAIIVTGMSFRLWAGGRARPLWLCLLAVLGATLGTVGFSANSEVLFVPLQIASLWFAVYPRGRAERLALSALFAVLAVNVNYVVAFALAPALLYALWIATGGIPAFLRRAGLLLVFALVFLATLLAALAAAGTDLAAYFGQQWQFLAGYAEDRHLPKVDWIPRFLILAALVQFGFRHMQGLAAPEPFDRALGALMIASAVSLILSAKYFPHYLYLMSAPAALLVLRRTRDGAAAALWRSRALLLLALCLAANVLLSFALRGDYRRDSFVEPYQRLASATAGQPVMAMRSSIVPQYYARVVPFQPYVWAHQSGIVFGPGEDGYFMGLLRRLPPFVLTEPGWCGDPVRGGGWRSCVVLARDYRVAIDFPGQGTRFKRGQQQVGYTLYQRR